MDTKQANTSLRETLSFLFMAILVASLFFLEFVKALPTIGILGFLAIAFIRKDLYVQIRSNIINKSYLTLVVFLFFYLGGILNIEDGVSADYWKARSLIKIPYLLLPLGLLATPQFSHKKYFSLFYLFFAISFVTAFASIINYIFNYDEINILIRSSKALPVVTNHVRYSLFVCFSIFIAWKLHSERFYLFSRYELWVYRIGGGFLIAFLHVAAVRSGLVAFYGMTGLVVIYQVILKDKRYKLGGGILFLMVVIPWLAFMSLTSIQKKVENMKDDLGKINIEERANNYSLTARWYSYKVGAKIFTDNLWSGVGVGNFAKAIKETYGQDYPKINEMGIKEPHNQFLYWLGSFGILGTGLLLFIFYFPLLWKKSYQNSTFLLLHYLIVTLSFMVENSIETQLGANYIVIFCVIPFLYSNENERSTN